MELRKGVRIPVVYSQFPTMRDLVLPLWLHCLGPIFEKGIYGSYDPDGEHTIEDPNDADKTVVKSTFQCYLDGDLDVPNLPWMEPAIEGSEPGSFARRNCFTSMKEYYCIMSLALVSEVVYQKEMVAQVFNHELRHKVVAEKRAGTDGIWHFHLQLITPDEVNIPKIPNGTGFSIIIPDDDAMVQQSFSMEKVDAKIKNRGAFVLEWEEEEDKAHPWTENGEEVAVIVDIAFNTEPAARSFRAIEAVSRLPRCDLTEKLLGRTFDKPVSMTPLAARISGMPQQDLVQLKGLLGGKSLNFLQWQALDLPLFSTGTASFIRGPPGTGKSLVIACLAIVAAVLHVPVMVCAPSNVAIASVTRKIIKEYEVLVRQYPQLAPRIMITILPAKKHSESLAKEFLKQCEPSDVFSGPQQDTLQPYQWYTKAIQEGRRQFNLDPKENGAWYEKLCDMERGKVLSHSDWSMWYMKLWTYIRVINNNTTLLLSTSNNIGGISGNYDGWFSKLKASGLIIMDEAGFEQEWSALVPLSCRLHRLIAELPRAISYKGLLTQKDSCFDDCQISKDWHSFCESSRYNKLRRETAPRNERIAPLERSWRRYILNVHQGSRRALCCPEPRDEDSLNLRLPIGHGVTVKTVDSHQGDENEIIYLCLAPATESDPAFLGFVGIWNRINVAVTRSKQALDLWRTRMDQIFLRTTNFALLVMDLADRGDIVDLDAIEHRMPKDAAEAQSGSADNWSLVCPPSQPRLVKGKPATRKGDPGAPEKFLPEEVRALRALDALKKVAKENNTETKEARKEGKGRGPNHEASGGD
ncbi:hypothetical protein EAF04_008575 [Stromatinia cepivora]|nr:hypothetical protein EAF04_008575 [Stromatinia cepivora]